MEKNTYNYDVQSRVYCRERNANFGYSDGDAIEEFIFNAISSSLDVSTGSEELQQYISNWPTLYHLSPARANLFRPIEESLHGKKVLELGSGCGAISRFLGEIGCELTCVEGSRRRATITAARCRDLENVKVYNDNFQEFEHSELFDVVTMIGVLEYSQKFIGGVDPVSAALALARSFLKPDGILLVAIENKLGLKYWAGAYEDHQGIPFYGIESLYGEGEAITFGRRDLARILKLANFDDLEFFYPFPDYKLPNLVLTDLALMQPEAVLMNLLSTAFAPIQSAPYQRAFSEGAAYRGLVENRLVGDMANSFLIVAKKGKGNWSSNKYGIAYTYSQVRRREFAKEVSIHCKDNELFVYRRLLKGSVKQPSLMQFPEYEPLVEGEILFNSLLTLVNREGWSTDHLARWLRPLMQVLLKHSYMSDQYSMLPGKYFDATPLNLIVDSSGNGVLFDLEWIPYTEIDFALPLFRGLFHSLERVGTIAQPQPGTSLNLVELTTQVVSKLIGQSFDVDAYLTKEADFQRLISGSNVSINSFKASILEVRISPTHLRQSLQQAYLNIAELQSQLGEGGKASSSNSMTDLRFTSLENVTQTNVIDFIESIQENTTISRTQAVLMISQDKVPELRDPAQRHHLYKEVALRMIEEGKSKLAADKESQLSYGFRSELANALNLLSREVEYSQADPVVIELKTAIRKLIELSDYRIWIKKHGLMEIDAQIFAERMMAWHYRPRFHLFMFMFNEEQNLLADTIDSLGQQFYSDWKLTVIADSAAPDSMFEELDVLEWLQFPENKDPYDFLNHCIANSSFDWIGFVPAGTRFEPQTWLQFGNYINHYQEKTAFYCDDDLVTPNGERFQPRFKPDFNLDLLRSKDYIGPIICKRNLFESVMGFDKVPGHENLSLALKVYERVGSNGVGHISDLLMHIPDSVELHSSTEITKQAVQQHLIRQQLHAVVENGLIDNAVRVRYQWSATPKVSIIIPTKDKLEFLRPCVEAALYKNSYPNFEVIVVNNRSEEVDTLAYFEELKLRGDVDVTILDYPHPFNYSAISNMAAEQAKGDYLLFLNNDTEAMHPEWLERMMSHAQRPEVGIVGARLVYPETGMLQHAGVIMGMTYVADHPYMGDLNIREPGYMNRAQLDQNFSAVTGACLLIKKALYDLIGGMNETQLAVLYNDVDLCLKVRETNHLVVWTPYAVLVHHGSVSQKSEYLKPAVLETTRSRSISENRHMLKTWMKYIANDPASNRHLSLAYRDLRIESEMPTNWDTTFHDRPRILGLPLSGGSGEYRVIQPFAALSQEGIAQCEYYRFTHNKTRPILVSEYARLAPDTVVFQAAVNDIQLSQLEQLQDILPNIFRIYTIDDLLTNVPEQSPAHKELKRHFYDVKTRLRKALQFSNRLIVSTQPLADLCAEMVDDIRVIPNRLPREPWLSLSSLKNQGQKPRVGWAGAQQHQGDLAIMNEVVKATVNEVDWIFMGMCPDEIKPYVYEYHNFVAIDEYPAKLASLNLDLAVAPLEIHPFNEAKSNLRLLEYGVLGWPVICTDIYPYQTNNPPVIRIENEVETWITAIRQLLADKAALADAGSALKSWVLKHYMLEDHLDEWISALTKNQ